MRRDPIAQRVIVVVLDGLRPDAIERFELAHLQSMSARGAYSLAAATVSPAVTVAAMTSLLTGVAPSTHGLAGDRIFLPRPRPGIVSLPQCLAERGILSHAFMGSVPGVFRGIAGRVARRLALGGLHLVGNGAADILAAARPTVRGCRQGFVLLHWPDADRAGHDRGWMSPAYGEACRRLDACLGQLVSIVDDAPDTLLIALADHGGGGRTMTNHESDHPLDCTIPLILSGSGVVRGMLDMCTLLDVPATVLFALGLDIPATFEGRVLHEAFVRQHAPMTAVA